jgi:hypothetical protein
MELLYTLWRLVINLWELALLLGQSAASHLLLVVWIAWWLFAVNWRKAWPTLRDGAWAPLVLLMLISALVWSRVAPTGCDCLGFVLPNFWWQLLGVAGVVCLTLLCGWLQLVLNLTPPEIVLDPPAASHHDHAH